MAVAYKQNEGNKCVVWPILAWGFFFAVTSNSAQWLWRSKLSDRYKWFSSFLTFRFCEDEIQLLVILTAANVITAPVPFLYYQLKWYH